MGSWNWESLLYDTQQIQVITDISTAIHEHLNENDYIFCEYRKIQKILIIPKEKKECLSLRSRTSQKKTLNCRNKA